MSEKKERAQKRFQFFLELWDKLEEEEHGFRFVRCFETGIKLSRTTFRTNSCCYSHLLPKSKYSEYELMEENVVIVHPDQHSLYESNREKTPKQNERRIKLLEKLK